MILGLVLLMSCWSAFWTNESLIKTLGPWMSGPKDQMLVDASKSQLNLFYRKFLSSFELGVISISYFSTVSAISLCNGPAKVVN